MKKRMLLLLGLALMAGCSGLPVQAGEAPTPTPTLSLVSDSTGGEEDMGSAMDSQKQTEKVNPLCLVNIDGMEYAVCNPKSYPGSAVFLHRAEGDNIWEKVDLKVEGSEGIRYLENPLLAFSSKEEGMLAFQKDVTMVLITKDGGMTWEEKKNIPEVGKSEHQMLLCLAAAEQEEIRFVPFE